MPIDPRAPGWDAVATSMAAEYSEAHAYAALARVSAGHAGSPPVQVTRLAGGLALRCAGETSTTLVNRVIALGLREPLTQSIVEQAAEHFGDSDGPWGMELAPAALGEGASAWLKQVRLRRSLATAMLAIDCRDLPVEPPPWTVRRVAAAEADAAHEIVREVFGVSGTVAAMLRRATLAPQFAQWLAFDGPRPVAACLTHLQGNIAWFGWSATQESHRGRGLQTALLWHSVRDAGQRGCRWVTAEAATGTAELPDASYRNMRRFGFVELYRRQGYLWVPPTVARVARRPAQV
jgi:GNAT superfamily N-acetyltransferase